MAKRFDSIEVSLSSADPIDDPGIPWPHEFSIERHGKEVDIEFKRLTHIGSEEWGNIKNAVDEALALFSPQYKGRSGGREVAKMLLKREQDAIVGLLHLLSRAVFTATGDEDHPLDLAAIADKTQAQIGAMLALFE